ncbi:MAG: hypothetical protein O3C63_01000 [Cyanobacteria bacterium]|nr:hypothetical protein [Cyanobacteriota bacterium]
MLVIWLPIRLFAKVRQANLPKKLSQYLKWEAIINDPLGVLITAIVYQYITYSGVRSASDVILIALATILLIFIISKQVQNGLGLLAVTLLGMYFANKQMLVLTDLKKFKESISIFSVSLVFILLSASINFEILQMLSWRHLVFILSKANTPKLIRL